MAKINETGDWDDDIENEFKELAEGTGKKRHYWNIW
jgi:hypothetical protein